MGVGDQGLGWVGYSWALALLPCSASPFGTSAVLPRDPAQATARPPLPLLFVVAKLDGQAVGDAAEGGWLYLPVGHWVVEEADAVVVGPFHPKAHRAEIVDAHLGDVVGMKVDHLGQRGVA